MARRRPARNRHARLETYETSPNRPADASAAHDESRTMYRTTPSQLRKSPRTPPRAPPSPPEPLEGRAYFAVHASFLGGIGRLLIFGDNLANNITVSRN